MTQEEKDLLLKDLCARLPYGVKVEYKSCACEVLSIDRFHEELTIRICPGYCPDVKLEDCKPFLRPMSSMTDEEFKEYEKENDIDTADSSETLRENLKAKKRVRVSKWYRGSDWLDKNHFDYRGLIPMGLVLDATGLSVYTNSNE